MLVQAAAPWRDTSLGLLHDVGRRFSERAGMSEQVRPSLAAHWARGHRTHTAQRIEVARKCLRLVRSFVSLEDVADFGCGIGAWLAAAKALGAESIASFEGAWIASSEVVIPREVIEIVDLATTVLDHRKRFSLALTIEVAEHLPPDAADGFVATLTNASNFILFSAALPGQGDLGHLNEQPLAYCVQKFWRQGYVPLEPIRPYIGRDTAIFPWIRQNIVAFASYEAVLRVPEAMRHARPPSAFSLHHHPGRNLGGF